MSSQELVLGYNRQESYWLLRNRLNSVSPGPQGAQGDDGTTGAQGATGDKGDSGTKGDKGDSGSTGLQGATGATGAAGAAADFKVIVVRTNDTSDFNTPTPTALPWDQTASPIDSDVFTHSTSTNPSRIIVDVDGIYEFITMISFLGNNRDISLRCRYRRNGSGFVGGIGFLLISGSNNSDHGSCTLPLIMELGADDYLEVMLDEDGGTSGTLTNLGSILTAKQLGP